MKTGIELIAAERERQITAEGWTPEHDDQHVNREMASAARCYVEHYVAREWTIDNDLGMNVEEGSYQNEECPREWPDDWDESWWKPKGRIADLTRAGALIAAEIDRLQRAGKS